MRPFVVYPDAGGHRTRFEKKKGRRFMDHAIFHYVLCWCWGCWCWCTSERRPTCGVCVATRPARCVCACKSSLRFGQTACFGAQSCSMSYGSVIVSAQINLWSLCFGQTNSLVLRLQGWVSLRSGETTCLAYFYLTELVECDTRIRQLTRGVSVSVAAGRG